jgi:IS30 family transposase
MRYKHLSIEEREHLQRGIWQGKSLRQIAQEFKRDPSTLSRELERNPSFKKKLHYAPRLAHDRALKKRKSRGREKRLKNDDIRQYVISHLKLRWSPEQIAGRIKRDRPGYSISHEAIYQYIYHQIHRAGYGYLKPGCEDLRQYLRRRKKRRTHKGHRRCQRVFKIPGLSIDLRPKVVDDRIRLGDWESDTVASKDNKVGINTLVERKTGLVFITKLKDKTSQATLSAIESRIRDLPESLKQTLTFDNGSENQKWPELEQRAGLKCFFAHPYHSWERGTNENTNGLIRDYFPKKTDFTVIPNEQVQEVEYLLNTRPRKRLDYLNPLEVFSREINRFNIILNPLSVALDG